MGTRNVENEVDGGNIGLDSSSESMILLHQYHHTHDPPVSSSLSWGVVDSESGGPVLCSSSNQPLLASYIGDVYDVSSSVLLSNPTMQIHKAADPFDHPGETMPDAVDRREVFTAAQWQELERQKLIYKHMMASAPVPPELLLSFTNNPPARTKVISQRPWRFGSASDTKNLDPEPWRCRRTDGKKWRCSRDAAPDQKYCERHSHKSRPRSRKPVELTPNLSSVDMSLHMDHSVSRITKNFHHRKPNSITLNQPNFPLYSASSSAPQASNQHRGLKNFTKEGLLSLSNSLDQKSESLDHKNMISLEGFQNLIQTREMGTQNSEDAWSKRSEIVAIDNEEAICEDCPVTPGERQPPGNYERGDEQVPEQMFISPHWMASPPGGPLAEALCVGVSGGRVTSSACTVSSSATNSSCSKSSG